MHKPAPWHIASPLSAAQVWQVRAAPKHTHTQTHTQQCYLHRFHSVTVSREGRRKERRREELGLLDSPSLSVDHWLAEKTFLVRIVLPLATAAAAAQGFSLCNSTFWCLAKMKKRWLHWLLSTHTSLDPCIPPPPLSCSAAANQHASTCPAAAACHLKLLKRSQRVTQLARVPWGRKGGEGVPPLCTAVATTWADHFIY